MDLDELKCQVKAEPETILSPVTELVVVGSHKGDLEVAWPLDEEKLVGNPVKNEDDSDFEWKLNEEQAQEQAALEAEYMEQIPRKRRRHGSDDDSDYELPKKKETLKKSSEKPVRPPPAKPPAPKTYCSDDRIRQFCELKCHECNTTIDTFVNLTKHFKKFHPRIKRYLICCYKKFSRRGKLNEHFDRHDETIEHRCEICKKTYINAYSLR